MRKSVRKKSLCIDSANISTTGSFIVVPDFCQCRYHATAPVGEIADLLECEREAYFDWLTESVVMGYYGVN